MKATNERRFQTTIWLDHSIAEVFSFFSEAKNLEKITPEWLHFKILKQSTPTIEEGCIFDYKLKIKGIAFYWRSKIVRWQPNREFMDIQLKGPYRKWEHLHKFEAHNGGTLMTDIVDYELPFGSVGRFFLGKYVDTDIKKIFDYRSKVIGRIFKTSAKWSA